MRSAPFLLLLAAGVAAAQGPTPFRPDTSSKRPLPLSSGRKVNFTTTKGSWMSLDVSPDGKTIVFDMLGDLYTLPIEGGKATQLTNGMAMDNQPRFSPDGKKIAYISDRSGSDNVWIISVDGRDTTQLTKSSGGNTLYISPEWTPDGKYVVASRNATANASKLWIYHVDGGTGVALGTNPGPMKMTSPSVSPDGRYVWYATRTGDWQYNAVGPQYQLAVYDRETGTNTTMSQRYGSAFRPRLSRDGKWITYGTRHENKTGLRIRNMETGEEKWLAYPIQRDDAEARSSLDVLPGYAWAPDDKSVILSYGGEIWRVPVNGAAPAKIPFTADVALDVGPEVRFAYRVSDSATFTARQIRDVAPSPDGKRLAFSAMDRLYIMDLPNGQPRRLTDFTIGEFEPTWSPDGKSVAFVTWAGEAGGGIYRIAVDGKSKPQQLTRAAALYYEPAWSPDGKRIVAIRAASRDLREATGPFFGHGLGAQFVWVAASGGDVTTIAPTGNRYAPHFSSDTGRIYAYGFQDGLVSFRWDGTDVKQILKVTGPLPTGAALDLDGDPRHNAVDLPMPTFEFEPSAPQPPPAGLVMMSPKGDRALAQVGNDVYVVTVPFVGGNTPTVSVASPDNAAFPVKRLTDIGGEFPIWSADGKSIHWAIGNAFVTYDLDRAKFVDDSLKTATRAKADSLRNAAKAPADSSKPAAKSDSAKSVAKADSSKKADKPGYKPTEQRISISVPRDVPQGVAVLRGARVVTMRDKEIIDDADIVVRNNRIVAVGKRGTVDVPADAHVIDVAGKTIVPGFVDTHYHIMWSIPEIHVSQPWQYLTMLAYGVTTTRDPQTAVTDALTYEDQVRAGNAIGPRVYSTGPGVFSGENIKDLDQARNVLKRYSQYYDTKTLKMYMTGNRQQRQWIIMAAKELGLMPTTEGGLDFRLDMTHAIDGYSGIEHALPITPLYNDVVQLFKGTGVTHTPTLIVQYGGPWGENYWYTKTNVHDDPKIRHFMPEAELDARTRRRGTGAGGSTPSPGPGGWFMDDEYIFPMQAGFTKDLLEAGGRAGIGSHGQMQGLGYHWEMWMVQSGGMSTHDALRAATIIGAQGIGLESDIGSIEPGKLADLVVLDKNPLEDIRNTNTIHFVMKNGRMYDGNTLDEVYPRQKPMPKFAWQDGGPSVSAGVP